MWRAVVLTVAAILVVGLGSFLLWDTEVRRLEPIRVGILHSQTGTMAISEKSMIDGELLAIDEINRAGGLLGRRIETFIRDGRSDWPTYAAEAESLITQDRVSTIFGCWTSASRKNVKPVVEKYNHLLIYPMAYEGLEDSPNIVYTGAAPNQQITPAVRWSRENLNADRFFLVGSDYIWPRCVNEIAKDQIESLGADVVGEEYLLLDSEDVEEIVLQILVTKPDVILSSVVGRSNIAFYRAIHDAGIRAPIMSVSIAEDEVRFMDAKHVAGNYVAWGYLQSIGRAENQAFVERFRRAYGSDRVTSDVIQTAYFSVHLWAQAVQAAGSDNVDEIRTMILGQSYNAPEGVVSVDPQTRHTWRSICIGQIQNDRTIRVIDVSDRPIRPIPYPITRSKAEWDALVERLYQGWEGSWANPGRLALLHHGIKP